MAARASEEAARAVHTRWQSRLEAVVGAAPSHGALQSSPQLSPPLRELIEMFRKLLFTSVIMFLAQGTSTQIVWAMFISFCWLLGHLMTQAYKEVGDSMLQTCSMLGIFLSLWLGLLVKVGIDQELDLPDNPIASAVYEWIAAGINMLPVTASMFAVFMKFATVCLKLPVWKAGILPDLGCGAAFRLFTGDSLAKRQESALMLALALNTDGDLLGKMAGKGAQKHASKREQKLLKRERSTKDSIVAARGKAEGKVSEEEAREARELKMAEQILEQAKRARAGDPFLGKDRNRKLFLLELRISCEAIVMRHYPIGKGFICHLLKDDSDDGITEEEDRPPYLFVKIWKLRYEMRTGFVRVKYDMRDTGFKVLPRQVDYHPSVRAPPDLLANNGHVLFLHRSLSCSRRLQTPSLPSGRPRRQWACLASPGVPMRPRRRSCSERSFAATNRVVTPLPPSRPRWRSALKVSRQQRRRAWLRGRSRVPSRNELR